MTDFWPFLHCRRIHVSTQHVQDAAILAAQAAGCAAAQAAAEAGSTKARVEKAAAAATQRAAAALQLTPARVLWHGVVGKQGLKSLR